MSANAKKAEDLVREANRLLRNIRSFEANQGNRPPFSAEVDSFIAASAAFLTETGDGA